MNSADKTMLIEISHLIANPKNPRKDLGNLEDLAGSIATRGILQPLRVIPAPAAGDGMYMILLGHRRAAAAKLAGLTAVPCTIGDESDALEQITDMYTENTVRQPMSKADELQAFQTMLVGFGGSIEELSKRTGVSESTARSRAKLAKNLNPDGVKAAEERGVSMTQLAAIADLKDPKNRDKVMATVGTKDYFSALKDAQDDEELHRVWGETEALVSPWALKVKTQPDNTIQHGQTFKSARKKVKAPEDAAPLTGDVPNGKKRYYYTIIVSPYMSSLTIYRDMTSEEAAEAAKAKQNKGINSEAAQTARVNTEIARTLTEKHWRLRQDFIGRVSRRAVKEQASEIFAAIVPEIMKQYNSFQGAKTGLKRYFGDLTEQAMEKAFTDLMKTNAPLALLYALASGDDKYGFGSSYYVTNWSNGMSVLAHKDNVNLNRWYDLLGKLGYQMSTEEEQMRNGTHPVFGDKPAEETTLQPEESPIEDGFYIAYLAFNNGKSMVAGLYSEDRISQEDLPRSLHAYALVLDQERDDVTEVTEENIGDEDFGGTFLTKTSLDFHNGSRIPLTELAVHDNCMTIEEYVSEEGGFLVAHLSLSGDDAVRTVLFSDDRISQNALPAGLHAYELVYDEDYEKVIALAETVNDDVFCGVIFTPEDLDIPDECTLPVVQFEYSDEYMTFEEYMSVVAGKPVEEMSDNGEDDSTDLPF